MAKSYRHGDRKARTDYKVVKDCSVCRCKLPKYNRHHWLCQTCWEEQQLAKGNLALIGGVK
ncbi:MAG: hypothetical protein MUP55_00545 [Candidatus Aenigmarchaeota archaeon]|nr:hypothetical protein [Candidatus Aenigmarchaeota archaeon]